MYFELEKELFNCIPLWYIKGNLYLSTYFGIMWINTFRTQGDMLWVAGDLKWTFKIPTVTIIDSETKHRRKKIKYFLE